MGNNENTLDKTKETKRNFSLDAEVGFLIETKFG